jgi:hypothetical protein
MKGTLWGYGARGYTAAKKWRIETFRVWHGATENGP